MSGPNGATLVVLAAGLGARFGGPKQFFELGPAGETLADYSLYDAWRAGFSRAIFVVRPGDEALARERYGRWNARIPIETAPQRLEDLPGGLKPPIDRTKPWGTAHALWCARGQLHGPFASINADDFYGKQAFDCAARALAQNPKEGVLVAYRAGETLSTAGGVARGYCRSGPEGLLNEIIECRQVRRVGTRIVSDDRPYLVLEQDSPVSMNFWGFPAGVLKALEADLTTFAAAILAGLSTDSSQNKSVDNSEAELALPEAVAGLLESGALKVRVLPAGRGWIGVTYREDAPAAAARLRALAETGEYPANLI